MKHRKPAPTWHRLGLKISKKVVVGITAAATAFGGLAIASTAAQASTDRDSYADTVENTTFEQARKHYGLAQQMSEGATLHAWEWSFKTIEENIPAIAEAGYTSVQTEPISAIHNGGKGNYVREGICMHMKGNIPFLIIFPKIIPCFSVFQRIPAHMRKIIEFTPER